MQQQLNTLNELANAVSTVAEIARQTQSYRFNVNGALTLYLDAESAEIRVLRHADPHIEVTANLQMPFAWRIATDQDDAGVYVVARRRPVIGSVAAASFVLTVRADTHIVLKLKDCRLSLDALNGMVELPAGGGLVLPTPT